MDFAEANPHQLALTMGIMGIGIMSSVVLLSPPRRNWMINGDPIYFGTVNFYPTHQPFFRSSPTSIRIWI
jgi:hypothetical protein